MPNTASAKKRVRQTAKRRALNRWRKVRVKDLMKAFTLAVQEEDLTRAEAEFRKACSALDRIACTSTLHRNTAARRKSLMSRRLRVLKESKRA